MSKWGRNITQGMQRIQLAVGWIKNLGFDDVLFPCFGHVDQVKSEEGENQATSTKWVKATPSATVSTTPEARKEEFWTTF